MAVKKVTRKDLLKAPDEFLSFSEKAFQFVTTHSRQFAIGTAVFVLLILVFVGVRWYNDHYARQALQAYNKAVAPLLHQTEFKPDVAREVAAHLNDFISDFSRSAPAHYAILDLSLIHI